MADIITIGGATRDFFFEIGELKPKLRAENRPEKIIELPYGEKLVSSSAFYSFGGGAVNTAVSFARLGLKTATVCNLGNDGSGRLVKRQLREEGVSTGFVTEDTKLHTGLSVFILGDDAEHTGFLERGANNNLRIARWRPLKKTKWFYVSSLTGAAAKNLPSIFSFAQRNNIRVAFNPGSAQLALGYRGLKDFLKITDVLLVNYEEAENLVFSKTKKNPPDEDNLLKELEKMGPKIVVVTMDGCGSRAISKGIIYREKSYAGKVIDTTGAGDAFGSSFVYGVMRSFDIKYCLKIAALNAGSVVEKMGATDGLLTYNSIKRSKWL